MPEEQEKIAIGKNNNRYTEILYTDNSKTKQGSGAGAVQWLCLTLQ